jgi:hypothetical protein
MIKTALAAVGATAVVVALSGPASAFVGSGSGVAAAIEAASPVVDVKRGGKGKHKGWGKRRFGHPPGWSRGRKVGWRGGNMPPGLAKKGW